MNKETIRIFLWRSTLISLSKYQPLSTSLTTSLNHANPREIFSFYTIITK